MVRARESVFGVIKASDRQKKRSREGEGEGRGERGEGERERGRGGGRGGIYGHFDSSCNHFQLRGVADPAQQEELSQVIHYLLSFMRSVCERDNHTPSTLLVT